MTNLLVVRVAALDWPVPAAGHWAVVSAWAVVSVALADAGSCGRPSGVGRDELVHRRCRDAGLGAASRKRHRAELAGGDELIDVALRAPPLLGEFGHRDLVLGGHAATRSISSSNGTSRISAMASARSRLGVR